MIMLSEYVVRWARYMQCKLCGPKLHVLSMSVMSVGAVNCHHVSLLIPQLDS